MFSFLLCCKPTIYCKTDLSSAWHACSPSSFDLSILLPDCISSQIARSASVPYNTSRTSRVFLREASFQPVIRISHLDRQAGDNFKAGTTIMTLKKVVVAGGTGFVGTRLVRALVDNGADVTVLTRSTSSAVHLPSSVSIHIQADAQRIRSSWNYRKKRVQHFLSSTWTREDVEPHQRLRVESPKKGSDRPRRRCALKLATLVTVINLDAHINLDSINNLVHIKIMFLVRKYDYLY